MEKPEREGNKGVGSRKEGGGEGGHEDGRRYCAVLTFS